MATSSISCLQVPKLARKSLQRNMDKLSGGMGQCVTSAEAIEDAFEVWRDMALELELAASIEKGSCG